MLSASPGIRRRSLRGLLSVAGAAELCELRSLMSAVMPSTDGPELPPEPLEAIAVDPVEQPAESLEFIAWSEPLDEASSPLHEWRQQNLTDLLAQADDWYGAMFGQTTTRSQYGWFRGPAVTWDGLAAPVLSGIASDALSGPAVESRVSQTNTQVAGVDEADMVETDGDFLYVLSGQQLFIVRAGDPAELAVVSQTPIDGSPMAMFLNGDRLTVLSQPNAFPGKAWGGADVMPAGRMMMMPVQWNPSINVSVFELGDRRAPELLHVSQIDGSYLDARAVGDDVLIAVQNGNERIQLPSLNWVVTEVHDGTTDGDLIWPEETIVYESRDEYVARLVAFVSELTPPSVQPTYSSGSDVPPSSRWLTDDLSLVPRSWDDQPMTSIVRISTTIPDQQVDTVSVAAGWGVVLYATESSLYLASSESVSETQDPVLKEVALFAPDEGAIPVEEMAIQTWRDVTTISQIDLTGDQLQVVASGQIDGTIADSYSMDEYDGRLRVAVTVRDPAEPWNSAGMTSSVLVLDDVDGALEVIGALEGLAPGEMIYSVRFDETQAWVTTFERVDPLFSIDLSDPAHPAVTDELKIPGFSEFMQLIDQNHLLTIGRNADPETGEVRELQISLFDVSDASNAVLLHQYSFDAAGYLWSEASLDPHAFMWIPDQQVLAIPLQSFVTVESDEWHNQMIVQDSLAVLSVRMDSGISLLSTVEQSGDVVRGVQVGDYLYSVSTDAVSVVDLDQPEVVLATVPLILMPLESPETDGEDPVPEDPDPVLPSEDLSDLSGPADTAVFMRTFMNSGPVSTASAMPDSASPLATPSLSTSPAAPTPTFVRNFFPQVQVRTDLPGLGQSHSDETGESAVESSASISLRPAALSSGSRRAAAPGSSSRPGRWLNGSEAADTPSSESSGLDSPLGESPETESPDEASDAVNRNAPARPEDSSPSESRPSAENVPAADDSAERSAGSSGRDTGASRSAAVIPWRPTTLRAIDAIMTDLASVGVPDEIAASWPGMM